MTGQPRLRIVRSYQDLMVRDTGDDVTSRMAPVVLDDEQVDGYDALFELLATKFNLPLDPEYQHEVRNPQDEAVRLVKRELVNESTRSAFLVYVTYEITIVPEAGPDAGPEGKAPSTD